MLRDCRYGSCDSNDSGIKEMLQSAIVSPSSDGKEESKLVTSSNEESPGFPLMYSLLILGYDAWDLTKESSILISSVV